MTKYIRSLRLPYLAGVAAAFVMGGVATAVVQAHGGDANQVHGCVNQAGYLRIVGPETDCKDKETALDWGIVGPQGVAGQDGNDGRDGTDGTNGVDGADGVDGIDGASGVSGYERIVQVAEWGGGGKFRDLEMQCPTGKKVLSGGFDGNFRGFETYRSFPLNDTTWRFDLGSEFDFSFPNQPDGKLDFPFYIICANAS